MSPTMHDEFETHLRELFERQAESMSVDSRAWNDTPMTFAGTLAAPRRPRSAIAAIIATAAAVALVVGVVAIAPGDDGVHVGGRPGAASPVQFATRQVSLSADEMTIEAGGRRFTAGGSIVDVNSDPENMTLELVWTENGTEMRLNIYFKSDRHNWWADEIRTYNGKSPGDWIEYFGTYFRTPLGAAFTGDVDLAATGTSGHLHFSNLRLQAFLPPPACKNARTKYALDPSYDKVDLVRGADGFGLGTTTLLDTASCTAVADPHAFSFDWQAVNPAIVNFETYEGNAQSLHPTLTGADPTAAVDLYREGAGSTMLRVTARQRSTGKVVATIDIPVTVH